VVASSIAVMPGLAQAEPSSTDAKIAEDLANQAFDAYSRGDFQSAVSLYKRAYQTSSAGVILFNIANIYDKKLREKELALDYYRRYLRSGDTEPDLVKRASERIDIVRADIEAAKAASDDRRASSGRPSQPSSTGAVVSPPPPPPPPEPPMSKMMIASIGATALGVVTLGFAGYAGYHASSLNDDAKKLCRTDNTCAVQRGVDLTNSAKSWATASTIGFLAGGLFVAGGVALYLYSPTKEERMNQTAIRITPQLSPEVAGFAISGVWQ
jgi:tetratricopeptide (TPR) repeat protein